MTSYFTLDELAQMIQRERQLQEDTYADAASRVNEMREDDEKVDRFEVFQALNKQALRYGSLIGELARIYVGLSIDAKTAYFPAIE